VIAIFPDLEALSAAAAQLVVDAARESISRTGRFSIALSGGSTPRRLFDLLAGPPWAGEISWADVHVFWADERCVPPDDERSNEHLARVRLLNHVPVPPSQIHPIRCAGNPMAAAARYDAELRRETGRDGRLDLILLGLGDDGHTASLFPGTAVVGEASRWAAEVWLADQQMFRVTMTAPFINQAARVAFLVTGAAKAPIVRDVIYGRADPERRPAQLVQPSGGELRWLLDREAARLVAPADGRQDRERTS
jgi:6-phosphogluconolactonase